ncbi:MAG: ABC transporter substrate-binding protein [bacterium]|nr:ABC transporter substrate-binding protein [bacterium]
MTPTRNTPGLLDARGVAVVPGPYLRVASLVPSLTDTVFGLGRGDNLVARTAYCEEPRGLVARVPACGGTKNPRLDAILALRPDLVLACLEENKTAHLDALAAAGVPVFAVMPRSLDDVDMLLKDLGILLDAEVAALSARETLAAARADAAAARGRRPAVAAATLIWKDPWMAAGGHTHIDAVMAEVGLRNVYAGHEDYPATTLEELAALAPALVLLPDEPYHFTKRDAAAVAEAALLAGPERCPRVPGKLLSWYGTRTAGSLRELLRLLDRYAPAAPAPPAG